MSALSQFFGSGSSFQEGIYQQEVYDQSNTFVVPQTGKYLITAVGGGGSGGSGAFTIQGAYNASTAPTTNNSCGGGSGGGAGGFSQQLVTLEAGTVLNITVGAGGSAITHPGFSTNISTLNPYAYAGVNGSAGGNTTVTNTGGSVTINMVANGGQGGQGGGLRTTAGSTTEAIGGAGGTASGGNLYNLVGQQGGNAASVTFNTDGQRVSGGGDGGTVNGIARRLQIVPRAADGLRAAVATAAPAGGWYSAAEHQLGCYSVYFPKEFNQVPAIDPWSKAFQTALSPSSNPIDLEYLSEYRFLDSYKLTAGMPFDIGTTYRTPGSGFRAPAGSSQLFSSNIRMTTTLGAINLGNNLPSYLTLFSLSNQINQQVPHLLRHGAFVGGCGQIGAFVNGVPNQITGTSTATIPLGGAQGGADRPVSYGAGSGGSGGIIFCYGLGDNTTNRKIELVASAGTVITPSGGNGFVVIEYMLK